MIGRGAQFIGDIMNIHWGDILSTPRYHDSCGGGGGGIISRIHWEIFSKLEGYHKYIRWDVMSALRDTIIYVGRLNDESHFIYMENPDVLSNHRMCL